MSMTQELVDDLVALKRDPPTVLVVEDDDRDAFLIKKMLEELQIQVARVDNADAALTLLRGEHKFRAILLDLKLPGLHSWQDICESAKAIPVIITSGVLEMFDSSGRWGTLTALQKPVERSDIVSSFRRLGIKLPGSVEAGS